MEQSHKIEGNRIKLKNLADEIMIGEAYKAGLMEIMKGRMLL